MQILLWLFGVSHMHHHSSRAATSPCNSRSILADEEEAKVCHQILFTWGDECLRSHEDFGPDDTEGGEQNEKTITILLSREDSKTWFFSTLYLKSLRIYGGGRFWHPPPEACTQQWMGYGVEGALVGCKVLAFCDAAVGASTRSDFSDVVSERDVRKGERRNAISRVKELVRWAAAAKYHKRQKSWKVSYFMNRDNSKTPHGEPSSRSSNISFKWEVGSCSSSSSAYSPVLPSSCRKQTSSASANPGGHDCHAVETVADLSAAAECRRAAHWITTDSDFVVLEL